MPLTESSDEQILEIVKKLRLGYELKRTLRYATSRDQTVHNESVAEHVFALLYLSHYFLPLEDPRGLLDAAKVHSTLLFHDFGEIIHGDVPYHLKTDDHAKQEYEDARKVFASLPAPMGTLAEELWREYEHKSSPEARFVNALDKIEPLFELFDPVNEQSMKRLKFPYGVHIEKKLKATADYPVMRKFLDVISRDMVRRGVFWVEEAGE